MNPMLFDENLILPRREFLQGLTVTGVCALAGTMSQRGLAADLADGIPGQPGILSSEYIYEEAPFPSCHASTIAETDRGLIAAWFGGTAEGNNDVTIWASRQEDGTWQPPVEVADGIDSDRRRYPCWNPVLFVDQDGTLLLFYKVGPSPSRWWGLLKRSTDGGRTWSAVEHLPLGIFGPIRNKPVKLDDGTLLCGSSTEHDGWRVQMERAHDRLREWEKTDPLNDGTSLGLIQPTILIHPGGRLQVLCRSRQKRVMQLWSDNGGKTWTRPEPTELPNPNSGIDGVTLTDGRHLLVYNHTERGRSPLNVALSTDGQIWKAAAQLERNPGEYSYPAVIQTRDGRVHVTYTWNRKRIRHVVLDPQTLVLRELADGQWPK